MAIEIEKKFSLTGDDKAALVAGAESLGTKTFTDVYYDNAGFDLTSHDIWLRVRDGRWELKIPLSDFQTRKADQYRELETESEIADRMKLSKRISLASALAQAGYAPFATIATTRTKYKKEGFGIDLDSIDFGYELAEIEKMVADESEIAKATDDVLAFAGRCGLTPGRVRGKVIEYLFRNARRHFDALVAAGVVDPDGAR